MLDFPSFVKKEEEEEEYFLRWIVSSISSTLHKSWIHDAVVQRKIR